jgi:hypothetical protein
LQIEGESVALCVGIETIKTKAATVQSGDGVAALRVARLLYASSLLTSRGVLDMNELTELVKNAARLMLENAPGHIPENSLDVELEFDILMVSLDLCCSWRHLLGLVHTLCGITYCSTVT